MLYWFACWFHFRPHQGVCDTPLHLFDCILGLVGLVVDSVSAHMRAYAIRPYTCSIEIMAKYGLYLPLFDGDTYKKNCLLRLNDALAEKNLKL